MLTPIKKVIENPQDIPNVPRGLMEYLQVQFNVNYVITVGIIDDLRKAGWSESYITGFMYGLNYASQTLDDMETRKELLQEEY
ncbi:MAG: hypothetical protein [Caudoviricetes sp.]|nr:MAG: hypothetical protein [Caudoviricetes sp.]